MRMFQVILKMKFILIPNLTLASADGMKPPTIMELEVIALVRKFLLSRSFLTENANVGCTRRYVDARIKSNLFCVVFLSMHCLSIVILNMKLNVVTLMIFIRRLIGCCNKMML